MCRMHLTISILAAILATYFLCSNAHSSSEDQHKRFKDHADRQHVLEELEHQISIKTPEQMSEEELHYYYFMLHDYDKNKLLDGLEIIKALSHNHEQRPNATEVKGPSEEEIMNTLDLILKDDDHNGDGYVSFFEFMSERAKKQEMAKAEQAKKAEQAEQNNQADQAKTNEKQ